MAKILVVDDETDLEVLIKQKFRKEIRNKEYEFLFAINGLDALEKLLEENESFDTVCYCFCLWRYGKYQDRNEQRRF
jgi:CheY-like chemotaxis protein